MIFKKRHKIVLPDTTLCSIVRDEKMNPAGGIERFVRSHVPYVEQAVIADTGSIDGTREILEELESQYPNLKIVDIPFNGYADARNRSLGYVQTRRALILDADELLTHKTPQNDWKKIYEVIKGEEARKHYNFNFTAVYPNGRTEIQKDAHNSRLLDMSLKPLFERAYGEVLTGLEDYNSVLKHIVTIKHFMPNPDSIKIKKKEWYEQFLRKSSFCVPKDSPAMCNGFEFWKEFNPQRDNYD